MKPRTKTYKPIFHRENRRVVVMPITLNPAVARAYKKMVRKNGFSSQGAIIERLLVLFLEADWNTRNMLISQGQYDPADNHVARKIRRGKWHGEVVSPSPRDR